MPPNFFARGLDLVRNPDVLVRVGLFVAAALLVWVITGGTGSYRGIRGFGRGTGTLTPGGAFDRYTGHVFTP